MMSLTKLPSWERIQLTIIMAYYEWPATPNQGVVSATDAALIDDSSSLPIVDPVLLQPLGDRHTK